MTPDFLELSPTGHIPLIEKNGTKVLSQGSLLFEWIIGAEQKAGEIFKRHEDDDDSQMKAMVRYFFKDLRSNTSQLIRRTALKIIAPE